MSRLNLIVDSVDNDAAYGIDSTEEKKTKTKAWVRSVFRQDTSPLPRGIWAGGTGYTEAKVASILRDFLQPDSKISLKSAAETLLALVPPNASGNAEVFSFGEICVELAEQIPYDHSSQLKLVQLLQYLARSPKFLDKYTLPVRTKHLLFTQIISCFPLF